MRNLKNFLFFLLASLASVPQSHSGEPWAPSSGYSSVNQQRTYNFFYYYNIEAMYAENETYEHETQVYNDQLRTTTEVGPATCQRLTTIRHCRMI